MLNLKHVSLITILFVAIISMPNICHCEMLRPNNVKLVEETCKQTPIPYLCVKVLLEAEPRGSASDVKGLALIMVDEIKARANETLNKINQLLNKGSGEKGALSSCANKYKTILEGDVPLAINALKLGDPKSAEDAASDSAVEATTCDESFIGLSPLTNENSGMHDVASVRLGSLLNYCSRCSNVEYDAMNFM